MFMGGGGGGGGAPLAGGGNGGAGGALDVRLWPPEGGDTGLGAGRAGAAGTFCGVMGDVCWGLSKVELMRRSWIMATSSRVIVR